MDRRPLKPFAETVDGLVLPVHFAGHPALDFCNTLSDWEHPGAPDYLKTYQHLAVWSAAAGIVDEAVANRLRRRARREPAPAARILQEARELRGTLYAVATHPRSGPSWSRVAAAATEAAARSVLVLRDGQGRWTLPESAGLRLPLLAVAREAGALLASSDLRAVHVCPGTGCRWLFLDRTGRRRWCTMATCGNRAKVRRFAERKKTAAPA